MIEIQLGVQNLETGAAKDQTTNLLVEMGSSTS